MGGLCGFVFCASSWLLFNYNNDLFYDLGRYAQCYCCYECCWSRCGCFLWDSVSKCSWTAVCCWCFASDKMHDSDSEEEVEDAQTVNADERTDSVDPNAIYARGSLRRLHQK